MKSTGIVRCIDALGRITLPRELTNVLGLKLKTKTEKGTPMEIFSEGEQIILKKYQPGCIFCNSLSDLTGFKGKLICIECSSIIGKI